MGNPATSVYVPRMPATGESKTWLTKYSTLEICSGVHGVDVRGAFCAAGGQMQHSENEFTIPVR